MHSYSNKLWLCLRFHKLPIRPLECGANAQTEEGRVQAEEGRVQEPVPIAVLEKQRVLLANETATTLGIKPGMATATARTLAENVRLLERNPEAERRCLEQLCCWAYGISPSLYPYRDDSLLLANRIKRSGGRARTDLYEGVTHGFTSISRSLARRAKLFEQAQRISPRRYRSLEWSRIETHS